MSRTERYVGLERAETTALPTRRAQRRAALEEQLLEAFAAGDPERVSQVRDELAGLDVPEGGE